METEYMDAVLLAETAFRSATIQGTMEPGPHVESFTMASWPNHLGETPDHAIGKQVRVNDGYCHADFVISHREGESLCLRRIGKADFRWSE